MKTKYTRPTTVTVLIAVGDRLLAGSAQGVKATISGYDADADSNDGFSQDY